MDDSKNEDLSASLEDYLEAIFNLADEANVVRSKDIAETLSVAKSSVTGALRLLGEKGLIDYKPYGYVRLTEPGRLTATAVAKKHNIIMSFFINILGVEKEIAQKAACKAEHALGPRIISRLLSFIEFVTQSNKKGYDLAQQFREFCRTNQHRYDSTGKPSENTDSDKPVKP